MAAIEAKARAAEEAEVKAALSPQEFEAWMDEHRPGWRVRNIMNDTFRGAVLDQLHASKRMLYGGDANHFGGFAVIPISDTPPQE